jgi:GT2 family glycosyltransferase
MTDALGRVVLAISSFRSDESVLALLRRVFGSGGEPFGAVVVVDSLGTGKIKAEADRRGWPIHYLNSETNLGSAGNLALRLQTAADTGLDWCYAVNHDGAVDPQQVERLVEHGDARERIGAVYPSLFYSTRDQIEFPRTRLVPRASFNAETSAPHFNCVEVAWSSSNCALYSLHAVRGGIRLWSELWMGWEDLGLGWSLRKAGWMQIQCSDVIIRDSYEYVPVTVLGRSTHKVEKPRWYSYYQVRNLILLNRGSNGEACSWYEIARRIVLALGMSLRFDPQWLATWKLLFKGIGDGVLGRSGKGPVP